MPELAQLPQIVLAVLSNKGCDPQSLEGSVMNEVVGVEVDLYKMRTNLLCHTFFKYRYTVQCDYSMQEMVNITEIFTLIFNYFIL